MPVQRPRARRNNGSGAGNSGSPAVVTGADGATQLFHGLVSPKLWKIREADGFQANASGPEWDVVFEGKPVGLNTAVDQVTIRCTGRNDTNNMLPQVEGAWSVAIVVPTVNRFKLIGSVHGPMTHSGGVGYVPGTLIDASPVAAKIANFLQAHGGGHVEMPPRAGIYLKSNYFIVDTYSTYDMNYCFLFKADRRDQLVQFNSSLASGAGVRQNVSQLTVNKLWVFDNRSHQAYPFGQHAISFGSNSRPTEIGQRVILDEVHVRNFSGYGISTTNKNSWVRLIKRNGSTIWGSGDTGDRKNTLNGNYGYELLNEDHGYPAMRDIGTNLQMERGVPDPLRCLTIGTNVVRVSWRYHQMASGRRVIITQVNAANGITVPATPVAITVVNGDSFDVPLSGSSTATTAFGGADVRILRCVDINGIFTTNGQPYIEVLRSLDPQCHIGEKATFAGAGTVNNIPVDGVWDCTAISGVYNRFDKIDPVTGTSTGVLANATGSGGGSAATFVCPHYAVGDRISDQRSPYSVVRDLRVIMEAMGKNGLQGRGGEAEDGNGVGANYLVVDGYWFKDTTPAWIATAGGGGSGLSISGPGAKLSNIHIEGAGLEVGVNFTVTSSDCELDSFTIDGPLTGVRNRGDRNTIGSGKIKNTRIDGITNWGYVEAVKRDLGEGCFTPYAVGDSRVIVEDLIDPVAVPPDPGNPVVAGTFRTILGITQASPCVITLSSGGLVDGSRIGIGGIVVGMTQINGRVAKLKGLGGATYECYSDAGLTIPIDTTAMTAWSAGGWATNQRVRYAGIQGGRPELVPSNVGDYTTIFIDTEHYYIDALEQIVGVTALAVDTTPFGSNIEARYGTLPHTATDATIKDVEFVQDAANTATAIVNGSEDGIGSGDRGRSTGLIVKGVRNAGYDTGFTNYGTEVFLGADNIGIDSALPFAEIVTAADAGRGVLITISDSSTAVAGAIIAGGGANEVLARSNGTDWLVVA